MAISSSLSLPPQSSFGGLVEGDSAAVPLDGAHGDHPGQVLGVVAGGGKDDPLLSVMFSSISLPPQSSRSGLKEGDDVVEPLDGGHGDRLG